MNTKTKMSTSILLALMGLPLEALGDRAVSITPAELSRSDVENMVTAQAKRERKRERRRSELVREQFRAGNLF